MQTISGGLIACAYGPKLTLSVSFKHKICQPDLVFLSGFGNIDGLITNLIFRTMHNKEKEAFVSKLEICPTGQRDF